MDYLVRYRDISLFKRETYGIESLSFDIRPRRKYNIITSNEDVSRTIAGILEGRYVPDSGIIQKSREYFVQSDRLLLEDKVFEQTAGKWLNLANEMFHFGGRQRSKRAFMDKLDARSIRYFPVYRLKGEDRLKFTLLALTFQEKGLIVISRLQGLDLPPRFAAYLADIIKLSECAICLVSSREQSIALPFDELIDNSTVTRIDLTESRSPATSVPSQN